MLQPQCLFYSNTSANTGPQHQNCFGRSMVKHSVQRTIFFQTEELASANPKIQLEFPFCRLIKPVASTTKDNNFQHIGTSQSFGSSRRSFPRALYHSFVHPIEKRLFFWRKEFLLRWMYEIWRIQTFTFEDFWSKTTFCRPKRCCNH